MKTRILTMLAFTLLAIFTSAITAFAVVPFPNQPVDLPPGAMNYDSTASTTTSTASSANGETLPFDPNIVAAVIGVAGLLAGSIITILATYFMRWMDVRREDRREDYISEKSRHEKELALKHETYRDFLVTLAGLEAMRPKDFKEFKKDFAQAEISLDLAASEEVRRAKDLFKASLLTATEKAYETGSPAFDPTYGENRDKLIGAIRADIDIFRQ